MREKHLKYAVTGSQKKTYFFNFTDLLSHVLDKLGKYAHAILCTCVYKRR